MRPLRRLIVNVAITHAINSHWSLYANKSLQKNSKEISHLLFEKQSLKSYTILAFNLEYYTLNWQKERKIFTFFHSVFRNIPYDQFITF